MVSLADVLFPKNNEQRTGRERGGDDQGTQDREGVGVGHRAEESAGGSAHDEQGEEGADDDHGGEEDWSADVAGGRFDALDQGAVAVGPVGDVVEDGLHDDDGAVDDDAEVDGPDGEQVRGLALHPENGDGEQQRQRHDEGHNGGAGDVAQEDEEDQNDQAHADEQVVQDVMGGDVDEVGAAVEGDDSHALWHQAAPVQLVGLDLNGLGGGQAFLILAHEHDAFDDVVLVAPADDAEPGLVAHDGLGDLADVDGDAVMRGDHHAVDVLELLGLDQVGVFGVGRVERVDASAEQADGPDVVGLAAEAEEVAADVGVGTVDAVFHLLQGDVVLTHLLGVEQDLVLLDGASVAGDVDDAGDLLEGPVQDPVLHGLELSRGVAGSFEDVADDLSGGAPGRKLGLDAGGEGVGGVDAVEDFLASGPVVRLVGELALDVRETGDGGAAEVDQARHAVEGGLQGDADEALHFLGTGAGVLGDDLDDRRSRVGIRFDVQIQGGMHTNTHESQDSQDHDQAVVQAPGDDGANHARGPRIEKRRRMKGCSEPGSGR